MCDGQQVPEDHLQGRRQPRWPALLLALSLACASCSHSSSAADGDSPGSTAASNTTTSSQGTTRDLPQRSPGCDAPSDTAPDPGGHVEHDIISGDASRSYKLYVPEPYDGSPTPLVIDLHGYLSGSDTEVVLTQFAALAEKADFVLATPQGNSAMAYWNATPVASLPDDVQFVSDVISDIGDRLCIDPGMVYVDGFSNGAFMASLVACRLADEVAAVAAVSGLMFPQDCKPARPMPILAFHGTSDEFVNFTGSPNAALDTLTWNEDSTTAFAELPFDDVTSALAEWAAVDGCASTPSTRRTSTEVELIEYSDCQGESSVQLNVIEGGGHTWPGSEFSRASESALGHTTFEIDATEAIWSFFLAHPMPPT